MSDRMEPKHAVYVALSAAAIGFCLVFMMPSFYPVAVPWYYPLEHHFALEVTPQGLAMDWYGRTLYASGAALFSYFVVGRIAARMRPLSPGACALWAGWVLTAAVLAMSLYTYQLAQRQPTPLPLPTWYVPK